MNIPFDSPGLTGNELKFIADVVEKGIEMGPGEYSRRAEEELSRIYHGSKVMLTYSGTTALEAVCSLMQFKPGDEVILPSYAFPSCANAVIRAGALPVLVDIEERTLGIDPEQVAGAISPKTRAILAIHYAGLPCQIEALRDLAGKNYITLIEDCAQAFMARNGEKRLGNFGKMSILSFSSKKPIHCGQGGAIILNDASLYGPAALLRDRGTNREDFFAGRSKEYSWQVPGTSFSPSEITSAFLWAQLQGAEGIIGKFKKISDHYLENLLSLEKAGFCKLRQKDTDVWDNGSLFYLLTRDLSERDKLIHFLGKAGITAQFHFVPLHMGPGKNLAKQPAPLPISENIYQRLVRLPLFAAMSPEEINYVSDKVHLFYGQNK